MSTAFDVLKGNAPDNSEPPKFKNILFTVLRWLLVLPVFMIGGILATVIAESWLKPMKLDEYAYVLTAFYIPGLSISFAAAVAPKGRVIVAVVLSTLLCIAQLFMLVVVGAVLFKWLGGEPHEKRTWIDLILTGLASVVAITASIKAVVDVRDEVARAS